MATVAAWTPDPAADEELAGPILRAEVAGLAVILPALGIGFQDALGAVNAMDLAIRRSLPTRAITAQWSAAGARSLRSSYAHWRRGLRRVGARGVQVRDGISRELIPIWVAENVARIEGLRDSVRSEVTRGIIQAQTQGLRAETLARQFDRLGLPARNGRMRGRGSVIARDQLSKLAGQIAQQQQLDAGVTEAVWRTMRDSRVRESHHDLQGHRFTWAAPPSIGIPGSPVMCRCYAEAVIDLDRLPRA